MKRDAIYAIIDGERDYQDNGEGNAKRHPGDAPHPSPGEIILLIEECMRKVRTAWYKPGGVPAAALHLRKVVALGVQFAERYGMPPRANHVPDSAGITGTVDIHDEADGLAPAGTPSGFTAAPEPEPAYTPEKPFPV